MLNWANRFNVFCFLDNNEYEFQSPLFDCILAAGCRRSIEPAAGNVYNSLQQFYDDKPTWLFGHLGYDLKNETEKLSGIKKPLVNFGAVFFFEPEIIIRITDGKFRVLNSSIDASVIFKEISSEPENIISSFTAKPILRNAISKQDYIETIRKLQQHIRLGDCYEINFCQQFFAEDVVIDPIGIYRKLAKISPNPFSALYKLNDKYCMCASPERYLQKKGNNIISQPIKGTIKRDLQNKTDDKINRENLAKSEKDKSENVMVVDLVRNDLSKICEEGSVKVEELFGIYSFPQVHQMISTITGTVKPNTAWTDIIKATFPMGSMTGAPKKAVMELIDRYESTGRGLFSGSIGYISPDGDFDFNVVIRSIFYDENLKLLSFLAGGGITFYSKAEDEYEESMLKAEAIMKVLK
ncbi:MAG: anthranilate synthase component I family protein [Ferruginibacter sp.]